MSRLDLTIVVPVFNNRATLAELVERTHGALTGLGLQYELLFVDDGSRDGSAELLRQLEDRDDTVRVATLTANFGSQSALCAGFDLARGKAIVCIDADLENLPEDIPTLLDELARGHDLVCGVRESRPGTPLLRRIGSRVLNAWVRRREGTRIRDIGCGMRAMRATVVDGLAAEGERRRLLTPLLLRRARSISEVPIRAARRPGSSAHSYGSLIAIAADYFLLSGARPFLKAGLAAVLLLPVAAAIGLAALVLGSMPGMVSAAILFVGGSLGCLLALIGEYAQKTYQLSQGTPFYALRTVPSEDHRILRAAKTSRSA